MAKIFTDCGFDAVTIANNHMYDFGPEALLDTRTLLLEKGIAVTGAGRDLDEAREPAIVETQRHQGRVPRLLLGDPQRRGSRARQGGIAPLRVSTDVRRPRPHDSLASLRGPTRAT